MTLQVALGSLVNVRQFFVWRLVWDGEAGKFNKTPCTPAGPWIIDASQPHNWLSYSDAVQQLAAYPEAEGTRYALGFWLTAELGYWFLDIDKCIVSGAYTPIATELVGQLPGCFFEFSSSGTGVHVIGRGTVPEHSMRNKAHGLELYTEQRGIAFGTSGEAWGCADVGSPAIASIASLYFPPRAAGQAGDWSTPRADWSGPADDDALIAKMRASSSTASKMGNRASFEQLWTNAPELDKFYGEEGRTERDAALAAHLAFWTGCDAPRMERLMRRSALAREKWDSHRTYLRELTIEGACARQGEVLKEAKRLDPATMYEWKPEAGAVVLPALPVLPAAGGAVALPAQMVSTEAKETIDALLDMVSGSTTYEDMHNRVIPAVRAAGLPPVLMVRLENAINKRLDLYDGKLPVAKLRALLKPPAIGEVAEGPSKPDWLDNYVYVQQGDRFHHTIDGVSISRTSFNAKHNRSMPMRDNGQREDAVQWALDRWEVPMVFDTVYYPGKPPLITYDGLPWANTYVESSHPEICEYTPDGVAAIEKFQRHVMHMCGGREKIYLNLMSFLAHNVQKPGVKIRWCPIIKGVQGDGKSMIARMMSAAMGGRNVMAIGPDIVANSGGFTDWAHGRALVAMEELHMGGKDRYRTANAMKTYVSNAYVTINGKGDKPKYVINTCNQLAFTNHGDAVPIESSGDRRWFVIFTPFASRAAMNATLGYASDEDAGREHFTPIFDSFATHPGQWRRWMMEFAIPTWFSADNAALDTEEKASMAANDVDVAETVARQIVEDGCEGVSSQILSTSCLSRVLKMRALVDGFDVPKTVVLHHIIQRMGFNRVGKQVKWNGYPHTVWVTPGTPLDGDSIRELLSNTLNAVKRG